MAKGASYGLLCLIVAICGGCTAQVSRDGEESTDSTSEALVFAQQCVESRTAKQIADDISYIDSNAASDLEEIIDDETGGCVLYNPTSQDYRFAIGSTTPSTQVSLSAWVGRHSAPPVMAMWTTVTVTTSCGFLNLPVGTPLVSGDPCKGSACAQ